jgi:hypothetical protein
MKVKVVLGKIVQHNTNNGVMEVLFNDPAQWSIIFDTDAFIQLDNEFQDITNKYLYETISERILHAMSYDLQIALNKLAREGKVHTMQTLGPELRQIFNLDKNTLKVHASKFF